VPGVERSSRRRAAAGGRARQVGGAGDGGVLEQRAGRTAQGPSASKRAAISCSGVVTCQAAGMACWTMTGLKLKNVATTTSAGTGPIGAAREAK
jgi:hypothetical protein